MTLSSSETPSKNHHLSKSRYPQKLPGEKLEFPNSRILIDLNKGNKSTPLSTHHQSQLEPLSTIL